MQHEDTDRDDVRITQVIDEAADVAIVTGIDAIHFSILREGKGGLASHLLFFFLNLVVLGFELSNSRLIGRCSTSLTSTLILPAWPTSWH